jgi:uncharacterized protein (DUF983 family)
MSDHVRECTVSGSAVTVVMAKDGAANFFVQIVGSSVGWLASAAKVEG